MNDSLEFVSICPGIKTLPEGTGVTPLPTSIESITTPHTHPHGVRKFSEIRRQPQHKTPRRPDRVSGKQPAKIDHIQNICQVLPVRLQLDL